MATVFLSEFLTSGAWPREQAVPASLATEGRAMLESVLADLLSLPELHVRLTWDRRLPPPDTRTQWVEGSVGPESAVSASHRVTLQFADNHSEPALRRSACNSADHVLLIAPEFDDILGRWIEDVSGQAEIQVWNATPSAVRLCANKLRLARHLQMNGIPVIATRSVADDLPDDWADLVVKPGDGAGSQGIQRLPREAFLRWKQSLSSDDVTTGGWIVQPWISGRTLSVAAIFSTDGSLHDIWPVAEQFLDSKTFAYLGGLIPAGRVNRSHIEALIMDVVACVSGLRGYIGFDLIERPNGEVVVVEINPRLTTSYIGYRTLAASSLASWLEPKAQALSPPEWTSGTVRFTAAGEVSFTQGTEDTPA
ncbi:MAG: ATP-grasp domain-containing protein [Planctomycetaceae bacterium]|nr:ATP-grasp domain-containing protein [Planctomycetaceae bacterium]